MGCMGTAEGGCRVSAWGLHGKCMGGCMVSVWGAAWGVHSGLHGECIAGCMGSVWGLHGESIGRLQWGVHEGLYGVRVVQTNTRIHFHMRHTVLRGTSQNF